MATLTIRKIPDEQIQQLKEVAEKNNFYDEIREFMEKIDFDGLEEGEIPAPERNPDDSRPPVTFE